MRQSPPMMLSRADIESQDSTLPGKPLHFLASIFLPAALVHPNALILLVGSYSLASKAMDRLSHFLNVPSNRIQFVPLSAPEYSNKVAAIIDFSPDTHLFALSKTSNVKFDVDLMTFSVDFDVSPDGAYVQEIKAQWEPLKIYLRGRGMALHGLGAPGNLRLGGPITVGTKIVSIFAFDRVASDRVENSVKQKLQIALKVGEASNKRVGIELFGAAGLKLQDGSTKPIFEFGVKLSIPLGIF